MAPPSIARVFPYSLRIMEAKDTSAQQDRSPRSLPAFEADFG